MKLSIATVFISSITAMTAMAAPGEKMVNGVKLHTVQAKGMTLYGEPVRSSPIIWTDQITNFNTSPK